MATLTVKPVKQADGTTLFRLFHGKRPLGEDQSPPRPTDGGGLKTKSDAEALRALILRRVSRRARSNASNE